MQTVAEKQHDGKNLPSALDELLENSLLLATPGVGFRAVAEQLFDSEEEGSRLIVREASIEFLARLLKRKYRQQHRRKQLLLPGYEDLGLRIITRDGKRSRLADATYRQLRDYLGFLNKQHREDPKISKLKELMEKMRKRAQRNKGITVAEVLGLTVESE